MVLDRRWVVTIEQMNSSWVTCHLRGLRSSRLMVAWRGVRFALPYWYVAGVILEVKPQE